MLLQPSSISWPTDLQPIPHVNDGCEQLRVTLHHLRTKEDLLRVLGQYIQFNAPFGAGVASLAGQVAVRRDLFGDSNEPIDIVSDRSSEIAAHIFAAAVEEFCGCSPQHSQSHRRLAQQALKAAGKFFGYKPDSLNVIVEPTRATESSTQKVQRGYGIGHRMNENALLHGIGFHIGSEQLAGEEFRIFDSFLRQEHHDLVEYMETVDPEISDVQTYIWFRLHTTVEDEHADHAVKAANLALQYYRGKQKVDAVKSRIVQGVAHFAKVQTDFIKRIAD